MKRDEWKQIDSAYRSFSKTGNPAHPWVLATFLRETDEITKVNVCNYLILRVQKHDELMRLKHLRSYVKSVDEWLRDRYWSKLKVKEIFKVRK